MPTCPDGHESATTDFCDVCGTPLEASPSSPQPAPAPATASAAAPAATSAATPAESCQNCGEPRNGRFCENCGYDYDGLIPAGPPAATTRTWQAVVGADRTYFEAVVGKEGPDAGDLSFPEYCPERRFTLADKELQIGRRSTSRGIHPEIDLSVPPEDPGVSHQHALLVPQGNGWAVVDLDSTNGTTVNDGDEPIPPRRPVALHDGDRIQLGAWTTITIRVQ